MSGKHNARPKSLLVDEPQTRGWLQSSLQNSGITLCALFVTLYSVSASPAKEDDQCGDKQSFRQFMVFQGQYDKAIKYYELALRTGLEIFTDDHPFVTTMRSSIDLARKTRWN